MILSVVICAVVALGLFFASVVAWGPWWRFPNMPTPEEWSAIFGASALIALGFAWYQIRQVDQSNKALIASNELARQVNLEAVRPRVQISLEPTRFVSKDRGRPPEGTLHIAIRNIGVSPASNVRMCVNPPFTSLEKFFKPGMMNTHFAEINKVFSGEIAFRTLNPGNTYSWFLGGVPELFQDEPGVPRRWEVEAEYTGTASAEPFRESFVLDLDVEKHIELPIDPLVRIGKDIEIVGNNLAEIKRIVRTKLTFSDDSFKAFAQRSKWTRPSTAGASRLPTWQRKRS